MILYDKSIETKIVPATDTKGQRVAWAINGGWSYSGYDYALNREENQRVVAEGEAQKIGYAVVCGVPFANGIVWAID